jgi:signal transduction histidine kinase
MSIRLYSRYPFPNRAASETYDDFELQALDALIANPEQVQTRVERRDGRRLVRLVKADRMQAACVACHNARSDTPRNDWKVGDVRGAIEVTVPVDRLEAEIDRAILGVGLALLAGIVALASVAILATRRAAAALQQLNRELETRVEARTSDLSQANADLHQALHHIERSEPLAALGALIAGMAHELNTPMANAKLVLSTLTEQVAQLRTAVAAKQLRSSQLQAFLDTSQQACALLQRNILRASELVADFKQVSADQTSRRRREFNLAELVAETLHTLAPSYKHSPVQISTAIPADIQLDSYPGPLEQIISNLVNNAVLHGLSAERMLHIQITAERLPDAAAVRLCVSDDGQGMSPEVAAQAFQPFFTTRLGTGGTGLGLHLVHTLIQEPLGGSLELDSQPGNGTRFSIHLPLVAPLAADSGNA